MVGLVVVVVAGSLQEVVVAVVGSPAAVAVGSCYHRRAEVVAESCPGGPGLYLY